MTHIHDTHRQKVSPNSVITFGHFTKISFKSDECEGRYRPLNLCTQFSCFPMKKMSGIEGIQSKIKLGVKRLNIFCLNKVMTLLFTDACTNTKLHTPLVWIELGTTENLFSLYWASLLCKEWTVPVKACFPSLCPCRKWLDSASFL